MKETLSYFVPPGVRDILPVETAEVRSIEENLRETFKKWGYEEIITPTFEYLDALLVEAGEMVRRETIKFFDTDGKLLALRPEMTTPIARVVAQRFRKKIPPFRLYYLTNVFREEPPQRGQQREFFQAGAELIGGSGSVADAEVIALMVEGLRNLGLKKFKAGISQIEIIRGLIESANFPIETQEEIKKALSQKDLVGLSKLVKESPISESKFPLMEVLSLRGGQEILQKASVYLKNEESRRAIDNLAGVYQLLKSYELTDFINFDLGVVRNFDYYTGIIFEVCAEGLGFPIGGGGRYDHLLSEFGWDMPAAGFAIGIERTHIALAEQKVLKPKKEKRVLLFSTKDAELLFKVAKTLRQPNLEMENSLNLFTLEENIELAKKKGIKWVIDVDNYPSLKVVDVVSGKSQVCLSNELRKILR